MNFRNLVLIVLSMIANQSFAQTCVPAPQIMGQPQRCWDGRLIGNGGVVLQQQVLTQQVLPVQLVQARQAIPANCQLVRKTFWERASNGAQSAFLDGVVGALAGSAVDRIRQSGGQWTHVGANAGAAVGFAQGISDEYTMICHNAADSGQQVVASGHNCPAGTSWRRLDWEGHPLNGKERCLPPQEVIEQQKAANSHGCESGTSWRRLDWEGHPDHDKERCLPPQEVIEQQKAAQRG